MTRHNDFITVLYTYNCTKMFSQFMACVFMKIMSIMVLRCALLSLCKLLVTTFFLIFIELWSGHALDSFDDDKDIIQPTGGDIEPLEWSFRGSGSE